MASSSFDIIISELRAYTWFITPLFVKYCKVKELYYFLIQLRSHVTKMHHYANTYHWVLLNERRKLYGITSEEHTCKGIDQSFNAPIDVLYKGLSKLNLK